MLSFQFELALGKPTAKIEFYPAAFSTFGFNHKGIYYVNA